MADMACDINYLEKKYRDRVSVEFQDDGHIYKCYSPYLECNVYSISWWERRKHEMEEQKNSEDAERQTKRHKHDKEDVDMIVIDDDAVSVSSANTSTSTIVDEDDIYTQCYRYLYPHPPLHASATSVTSVIKPFWSEPDFDMMRRFCLRSTRGVYAKCDTIDKVQSVWDARRDRGTLMHERFEHLANAFQQAQDGKCSIMDFKRFVESVRRGERTSDVGAAVDVALFRLLKKRLGIQADKLAFYRTEMRLFHPALHWPGSIDLLLYDHTRKGWVIVDYKRTDPKKVQPPSTRSRQTAATHPKNFAHGAPCMQELRCIDYHKYGIQLSLYRYILEHIYKMKIVGMKIVAINREVEETTYLDSPNKERSLIGKLETNMTLSADEVMTAWVDLIEGTTAVTARKRGARGAYVQRELDAALDSYIHVVEIPVKQYDRQIAFLVSERARELLKTYKHEMPETLIEDLESLIIPQ